MSKISKDALLKLEKKMGEKKTLKIMLDGKEYEFTIDCKFLNTKIDEMIRELVEIEENKTEENDLLDTTLLTVMLTLKHFTSAPYEGEFLTVAEKIEHYVAITNALKNLECEDGESVFEKLINAIDSEEISKVAVRMKRMADNYTKFVEEKQSETEKE